MRRRWMIGGGLLAVLVGLYVMGPAPADPDLAGALPQVPSLPAQLDSFVQAHEATLPVRPGNQARIIWADSARPAATDIAIVYLHGLTASQQEGDPVHRNVARALGANLSLARLADHGLVTDSPLVHLTASRHYASARQALAIGKQLGRRVVVMATSAGAALALKLAADHPEAVQALVLYSPAVGLFDPTAVLLDRPWGSQIAQQVIGGSWLGWKQDTLSDKFWYKRYHINGAIALQQFIHHAMTEETFRRVTCPVFLAYYYRDEEHQDQTVSVPAMLAMFDKLGTPAAHKAKQTFPNAGAHVIASDLKTQDWPAVQAATLAFLQTHVNNNSAQTR